MTIRSIAIFALSALYAPLSLVTRLSLAAVWAMVSQHTCLASSVNTKIQVQ